MILFFDTEKLISWDDILRICGKLRLILCGFGVVGQSLTKLLESRSEDLYARFGLKPRIVGVFDTKGSAVESAGLDLSKLLNVKKKIRDYKKIQFV